ncbi:MAG: hypothetical protein KAX84_09740 [Burkholderiales bacterium]|nr:hypothetical protein [Burkholderiales bacterium]
MDECDALLARAIGLEIALAAAAAALTPAEKAAVAAVLLSDARDFDSDPGWASASPEMRRAIEEEITAARLRFFRVVPP